MRIGNDAEETGGLGTTAEEGKEKPGKEKD